MTAEPVNVFAGLWLGLLCLAGVHAVSISTCKSRNFEQSTQLDSEGKYIVCWNFNATHITFEVHVETAGYVGFGISPNGNMPHSDVVIGWVKDGRTYFSDRHTTGHVSPEIDKSTDWFLLHGEESNMQTILRFVRKLDTCDPEDKVIDDQTVRLIYSYHDEDPTSETNLTYHGLHRGAKSVSLLSASLPPPVYASDDIKIIDLRNRNYIVPAKETTYSCTGFQLPDIGGKHHMIEYEVIITPGNEHHVHHIDVFRCNGTHLDLDMKVDECTGPFPKYWPNCPEVFSVWATGGGPFYFPEEAGYPVGGPNDLSFYTLQIHYDNPTHKIGIVDSSGVRIRVTKKLRQHDVMGLSMGHLTTNYQVIPPHEQNFVTRGYCAAQCLAKAMNRSRVQEVKVIGQIHHAHLLAHQITTRHFRNGIELPPIVDDPYYDVKVQEVRPVEPARVVKPGDSFVVECNYDTTRKSRPYFGGYGTSEEMCITFMYLYPDIRLMACDSLPIFDTYTERGEALHQKFLHMNWTDPTVKDDFYQRLHNSSVYHNCNRNVNGEYSTSHYLFKENVPPFIPKTTNHQCPVTGH